jgi:hypothetical protein
MEIETKNASLDTLAVTILALHVSGKQMTQAVFKQLPEGRESEGDSLWGVVRYQIKDSYSLWLVFSSGDRLYRRGLSFGYTPMNNTNYKIHILDNYKRTISKYLNGGKFTDGQLDKIAEYEDDIADAIELDRIDLSKQQYDKKLSTLQQLFIAV